MKREVRETNSHPILSILTPTYNRANTLGRLFDSLMCQDSSDFEWVVIDDGSTDETEELVSVFASRAPFEVKYHWQENKGKHIALNNSHDLLGGELTIIVDSDDCLTSDAVSTIVSDWRSRYSKCDSIAVLSYLKGSLDGAPVIDWLREDHVVGNHIETRVNHWVEGDCAEVVRTSVFVSIDFPHFEGERFLGESYLWNTIAYNYSTVYLRKVIYLCEYLEDGLTQSGRALRIKCPFGGMANEKTYIHAGVKLLPQLKHAALYDCYGLFAGLSTITILRESSSPLISLFTFPLGYYLYKRWSVLL